MLGSKQRFEKLAQWVYNVNIITQQKYIGSWSSMEMGCATWDS